MSLELLTTAPPSMDVNQRDKRTTGLPKRTPSQVVRAVNKLTQNLVKTHEDEVDPTLFKIHVDQVYNAIKGQESIRHLRPLPPNPKGPGAEEYCTFYDGMGHRTVDGHSLRRQLQELMN